MAHTKVALTRVCKIIASVALSASFIRSVRFNPISKIYDVCRVMKNVGDVSLFSLEVISVKLESLADFLSFDPLILR